MNKYELLYNQIESDYQTLKNNVRFGLYKENLNQFVKDARLIHDKITKLKEMAYDHIKATKNKRNSLKIYPAR